MVEENFEIRLSEMHQIGLIQLTLWNSPNWLNLTTTGNYYFTMVEENIQIRLSEMHQIGLI